MVFTIKSDLEQHDETSFDSMQEVRSDMMYIYRSMQEMTDGCVLLSFAVCLPSSDLI